MDRQKKALPISSLPFRIAPTAAMANPKLIELYLRDVGHMTQNIKQIL
jgi:hypothetical protein